MELPAALQLTQESFERPVTQGTHYLFGHLRETLFFHVESVSSGSPEPCLGHSASDPCQVRPTAQAMMGTGAPKPGGSPLW